jgi:hypothetical protein
MPNLQQQGWQRRHLDWEFKLTEEPAEVERTVVDGAINAMESFLRSTEVQRLFVKELVQGTLAEADQNSLRGRAVRHLIEQELVGYLTRERQVLIERMAAVLMETTDAANDLARQVASEGLDEVQHLLVNHAEAIG